MAAPSAIDAIFGSVGAGDSDSDSDSSASSAGAAAPQEGLQLFSAAARRQLASRPAAAPGARKPADGADGELTDGDGAGAGSVDDDELAVAGAAARAAAGAIDAGKQPPKVKIAAKPKSLLAGVDRRQGVGKVQGSARFAKKSPGMAEWSTGEAADCAAAVARKRRAAPAYPRTGKALRSGTNFPVSKGRWAWAARVHAQ